ncbi:hypothetical protein H0H93_006262, partial [Arthromyces matolae]
MAQSRGHSQPSTTKAVAGHKPASKVAGSRKSTRGKRGLSPSSEGGPATKKAKAAAARKAPAIIDPREDSSDQSLDEEPIAKTRRRAQPPASEEDDEESEAANSHDDADQEFEDGLEQLDAQSLRKTLASERPQWSKSKAQKKAQDDDVFNIPEYDIELTTASELDDHDRHHDEDEDEDEAPTLASSHRAKARRAE